ncbi:MAG: glycosyltransferase family 39 protein [Bacteroidia bacterium]|nr:glycosyltransferase family 39 protein [Bacteroidia bacterium]
MKKQAPPKKKEVKTIKSGSTMISPPSSRKANWYFVLFFFVWAYVLYGNTILNKYAVDDEFVTNNEMIREGLAAIPGIFSTHYINQKGNVSDNVADYRPIVKLTYALEYQIYQQDKPGRSHAVNVLIYFLLSTLLFFILKRMLKNYNILFPFLITVIFMAHPVHTEVVASLKNRDEMLAFLCGLGTLYFLLRYADTRKLWYLLPAFVVFVIGYLSKSSILPFVLIYPLALYFFTDLKPKQYLPIFIALVALAVFAQIGPKWFLPAGERLTSMMENPLFVEKGLLFRMGTGLVSLLFYLKILVYPHPLLFYYGYDMIPLTTPANIWAILSFLLYAGILIYALIRFREKQLISFAILWYLIFIAMYSNFLIPVVGIVGERFVFAASLGFCIALVWVIFKIFKTEPNSLTIEFDARAKILVVTLLILIPYAALTVNRNREWRNLMDLYSKDIPYLENSAKANTQYAGYLMRTTFQDPNFRQYGNVNQFKLETIKRHFHRSLEIYPGNYQTLNDLGTVYLFFGKDPDSALLFLKKAIDLNSELEPAWVNLGMAFREVKKLDSAAWCYSGILRRNPQNIRAYFALANVYNDMGEIRRAIDMNLDVLRSSPNLDVPYINIGNYILEAGDTAVAIEYYEEAVKRRITFEGCVHLSNLYKSQGDTLKSAYYQQKASSAMRNQP